MAKSSIIITLFMALNFAVVFLTQILLAALFGAKSAMDAYLSAMTIPLLLAAVLTDSLRVTFVPVFIEYAKNGKTREAWSMVVSYANLVFVILSSLVVVAILFAPAVTSVVVPGFEGATRELTINLSRIVFPTILFSGLSALLSSVYYARRRVLLPSVAPVLNSVVTILVVLILSPYLGIFALALGALIASIAQFLLLVPQIAVESNYHFTLSLADPGIAKVNRMVPSLVLGAMVMQGAHLMDRVVASQLPEGSVTYLGYGYKIATVFVVLLRDGISLAIFPRLASYASDRNHEELRKMVSSGIRVMLFFTIPVVAGLVVVSQPLIRLFFQRGLYSAEAATATAITLLCYLGMIFGWTLSGVGTCTFYALQDARTTVKVGVVAALINMILDLILVRFYSYAGVASALSISALFMLGSYLVLMNRRLGGIDLARILQSFLKLAACASLAAGSMLLIQRSIVSVSIIQQAVTLGLAIAVGSLVYLAATFAFRLEEIRFLTNLAINRLVRKVPSTGGLSWTAHWPNATFDRRSANFDSSVHAQVERE